MKKSIPLKILMVASECAPLAKAGGLGDVVSGLAKQLRMEGHDVRIFMPLYRGIDRAQNEISFGSPVCVHLAGRREIWAGVFHGMLDGLVPLWFLDHAYYFDRAGIYDENNREYADNAFRFAFFSKAALQVCKDMEFIPDVIHVHDWQGSPAAAYLKTWDRVLSPLSATASVLTIHNIGYQGVYPSDVMPFLGLGDSWFVPDVCEDHGRVNFLKMGVYFADAITTVSPTHAEEILTPGGGMGLAPYTERRRAEVHGILNGVDYAHWSPESDRLIPANYTAADLSGKDECRSRLKERMGLDLDGTPVVGVVSRFVEQKGLHLVRGMIERALVEFPFQIAVLGSGDASLEQYFRDLGLRFPGRAAAHIGFSNELSHWIEAGSDLFLVPSLYEPCGLTQIYSMRYGALPVVRATGGLRDTVRNYDPVTGEGTGFVFHEPVPEALHEALGRALTIWQQRPDVFERIRQEAMRQDFSWEKPAGEYLTVYRAAMRRRRGQLERESNQPTGNRLSRNPMLENLQQSGISVRAKAPRYKE